MEIADTFPMASFGGIEFPYQDVEISGSLDHYVHKYIHRPGGEVEELGRHLYEVTFTCYFDTGSRLWRSLYPQRLAELVSLCETGKTYPLVIPTRGVRAMKVKATKWVQTFTAKIRSGERIRFTFLEDTSDQFSPFQIVQFRALNLGGYATLLVEAAIAIEEPSIFDEIINAINQFEIALGDADIQVAKVLACVGAIVSACTTALALAALAQPTNWVALEALLDVMSFALELTADVGGSNRVVDKFFVPSTMSIIDLSMAIYGAPVGTDTLLSLNGFDDLLRIPAGTIVNYYADAA